MRRLILSAAALLVLAAITGHDMFLKLPSYFLAENSPATIALMNGTFEASENVITRDRMLDVSIVGPADERAHPDTAAWTDKGNTAWLAFQTGDAGTYVAGVSTRARIIALSAEDFNEYLRHDGVLDVLEERVRRGIADQAARERYSKHVKAVFQVGEVRTGTYAHMLGYPIEIVPQVNPYALSVGDELPVLVLLRGEPLPAQLVYASHEGYHGHDDEGDHMEAVRTRTEESGVARIPITATGRWYVRLIHMEESEEDSVDYESNWATLTFAVR